MWKWCENCYTDAFKLISPKTLDFFSETLLMGFVKGALLRDKRRIRYWRFMVVLGDELNIYLRQYKAVLYPHDIIIWKYETLFLNYFDTGKNRFWTDRYDELLFFVGGNYEVKLQPLSKYPKIEHKLRLAFSREILLFTLNSCLCSSESLFPSQVFRVRIEVPNVVIVQ